MKYYAVTDDPNELVHWGIKGMRWGVRHDKPRHTGSRSRKPRSAAYKKAQAKLSSTMRNGIKKVEAKWKAYNSPQAKEARFMNKAMQKARTGTLKYGKLTDDQVRRVTERLALERNARTLGNTEKRSYVKRLGTAIGEGIISGVGGGTGAYIEERFRGRGRTTADIKRDRRMTKYESDRSVQKQKAKNAADMEYYTEAAKRGVLNDKGIQKGVHNQEQRAKQLQAWRERDAREAERQKRQNAYYDSYIRTAAVSRAKNRFPEKSSNNNNNNNNNSNNNNGQNNPKLPVSVNIYNGNGSIGSSPRSVNGHMIRPTGTRRRTRGGGKKN